MAEIHVSTTKNEKPRRKSLSTRVDLTPMVDLGFLLITFFVFTTTLNEPKVMDLEEPKGDVSQPVPESGSLTFLLSKDHSIYYYFGQLPDFNSLDQIKYTNFQEVRKIITQKKNSTPEHKLMFVIKSTDETKFSDIVDILDEMSICGIKPGHYAEIEPTSVEIELLRNKKATN